MRVLYLTNVPTPYRVAFFNALGEKCDLTVIYDRPAAADREASWRGGCPRTYREVYSRGFPIGVSGILSLSALKHLIGMRYDLVVVGMYSSPTGAMARLVRGLLRLPYIISTDGGFAKDDTGIARALKTMILAGAPAYLSPGGESDLYLQAYGARSERIHRYPFTSVSKSELQTPASVDEKAVARRELGISEQTVLLSVGQIIPRKGWDTLISATEGLGSAVGIYIVGGRATRELAVAAERADAQIHFVEFLDKTRLTTYFRAADAFVLPTREDIWGLVINEALAHGLPVITTDRCNAGLEMIDNGRNGQIVAADDPEALRESILTVLREENLVKMSECSRNVARRFTIEKMAERHLEVFRTILDGRHQPGSADLGVEERG